MPRIKRKTKEEDLARVRKNQRNSRERKRSYIAELEQKIAGYEETTSEVSQLRDTVEALRKENTRLREMLQSSVTHGQWGTVEEFQLVSSGIGSLSDIELAPTGSMGIGQMDFPSSSVISDNTELPCQNALDMSIPLDGLFNAEENSLSMLDTAASYDLNKFILPGPDMSCDTSAPPDRTVEDTTLCAVALDLVLNCNRKNLGIVEIDMKLRCGYRSPKSQWESCRVENRVLLAVLAEISR